MALKFACSCACVHSHALLFHSDNSCLAQIKPWEHANVPRVPSPCETSCPSRRRERRRQAKSAQNELRPALRGRPARRGLAPPDPRRPAPLFDRASGPLHAHALAPALAHRRGRAARRAARGPSPYATARSNPARAIWASGLLRASTAHKPPRSSVRPSRPATRPTLGPPPRPEQVSRGKRRTAPASTAGCCARAAAASTASPTPTRCAARSSRPFPRRRRSRC